MKLVIVRDKAKYLEDQKKNSPPAPPSEFDLVRRWDSLLSLSADGVKSFREVKDAAGRLTDIQDVKIKGYLSTFGNTDRDGDVVHPNAFDETLAEFRKNPIMLMDHVNMVKYTAGRFDQIRTDANGLYVEASVTNSPAPDMVDLRFKVSEGSLRTLSMGGIFYYDEDRTTIFKVKLWEGSIVPIPANPRALFTTRALNEQEKKFLKSGGFATFSDFLLAQQRQNQMGVAA